MIFTRKIKDFAYINMDPVATKLLVYREALDGVLRILKETSWRIADNDSRKHIIKTIKKDLKDLTKHLDEYEEELTS